MSILFIFGKVEVCSGILVIVTTPSIIRISTRLKNRFRLAQHFAYKIRVQHKTLFHKNSYQWKC